LIVTDLAIIDVTGHTLLTIVRHPITEGALTASFVVFLGLIMAIYFFETNYIIVSVLIACRVLLLRVGYVTLVDCVFASYAV
jgi:hypothetical protein